MRGIPHIEYRPEYAAYRKHRYERSIEDEHRQIQTREREFAADFDSINGPGAYDRTARHAPLFANKNASFQ